MPLRQLNCTGVRVSLTVKVRLLFPEYTTSSHCAWKIQRLDKRTAKRIDSTSHVTESSVLRQKTPRKLRNRICPPVVTGRPLSEVKQPKDVQYSDAWSLLEKWRRETPQYLQLIFVPTRRTAYKPNTAIMSIVKLPSAGEITQNSIWMMT